MSPFPIFPSVLATCGNHRLGLACENTFLGIEPNSCLFWNGPSKLSRRRAFCPSSHIVAGSPHAAARARRQASSATLSAADTSHGSRQNPSTMDGARSALVPFELLNTGSAEEPTIDMASHLALARKSCSATPISLGRWSEQKHQLSSRSSSCHTVIEAEREKSLQVRQEIIL